MDGDFVRPVTLADCQGTPYRLAIFASGYEERSTHLPSLIDPSRVERSLVLGFTSLTDAPARVANDEYFARVWSNPIACDPDDDRPIYEALGDLESASGLVRILVDYSSMSRDWYAALLNWLATTEIRSRASIDFAYSIGTTIAPYEPLPVLSVTSVPGFEGLSLKARVVLVLGLGFDAIAPLAVLEQMEPTRVLAFIAAPGAAETYVQESLRANEALLREFVDERDLLRLPLGDVSRSVSLLSEVAAPLLAHHRVVFVPMGPKPHILAALLTCLKLPEAGVLHVRSQRTRADRLSPTGEVIANRVSWPTELETAVQLSQG